ncbi:MAG: Ig-like domain-containing protein, partial [Planctomycetota bacterium]
GNDTLTSIEGVTGSRYNDSFAFASPTNGATYTVNGDGGTDTIDLTNYATAAATINQGANTITMDMGGGQSFTINYTGVYQVTFSDGTTNLADAPNVVLDYIRVVTDQPLNDDFTGLTVDVDGYTLDGGTPYVTNIGAGGANDSTFYVKLVEGGLPDTDATPEVAITANTSLADNFTGTQTVVLDTATVEYVVVDDNEIKENQSSSADLTSSDIELGRESGSSTKQIVGLRYTGVAIPQGATITSAEIEFKVDENDNGSTSTLDLHFWAEDSDTPAAFTTANDDLAESNRPRMGTSVDWLAVPEWNTVGEFKTTPDLTTLIQAIVNRAGFVGNMSIIVTATGPGSRIAESLDGDQPGEAPTLRITYVTGDLAATDKAGPALLSATSNVANSEDLFNTVGEQVDFVFSESLAGGISEADLEAALAFAGGATDGDNLPDIGSGSNPISLITTNVSNDTIRVTFNTNNTVSGDLLTVGTHTAQVTDGTNITDADGNTASISAAAVTIDDDNTPPTAANNTITLNENSSYTFSAADFGFADVDGGDSLARIKITSLESVGTLQLNGTDVTLDQQILAADIPNLVFTPVPDASGTGYDSFDFKVHDGTEYSAASYTATMDVNAVTTVSWLAGENTLLASDDGITWTDVGLPAAMGGNPITDIHYGNGLWIAIGPGGKMMRSADGEAWTATDVSAIFSTVDLEDIHYSHDKGLWMVVANDWTVATSVDGINWTQKGDLQSSGSLGSVGIHEGDGVWFAPLYKSASGNAELYKSLDDGATWVYVADIDDTGAEGSMYANGISLAFTAGDGTVDNSLRSTDNWATHSTFTLPSGGGNVNEGAYGNGMFVIGVDGGGFYTSPDGVTWTWRAGPTHFYDVEFFNGTFVAQGWGSHFYTSTDGINWTSRIDAATDDAQEPAFGGVHNEPDALDFTDQTGAGTSTVVTSNTITVNGIAGPLYVFAGYTADVEVSVNGGAWKPGSDTTLSNLAQVNDGDTVQVRMTSDASGTTEKIVTVQIGTSITHWSVTTEAGNTAPTAADNTVTTNEDTGFTFSESDFGFSDADGGDVLTKIQITSLESAGTLKLSGADVALNQEILAADIGNLVFMPAQDANGTGYDSFDFKVHDGTEYSVAANTIT